MLRLPARPLKKTSSAAAADDAAIGSAEASAVVVSGVAVEPSAWQVLVGDAGLPVLGLL